MKSWVWRWLCATLLLSAFVVVVIGAFPVPMLRGFVEGRVSSAYGATVTISAIERDSLFSYHPLISIRQLRIAQPAGGTGDFLRIDAASVRVPVFDLLTDQALTFQNVRISGLTAALHRRADGTNNWSTTEKRDDDGGKRFSITDLVVENSRFTLRDDKRGLSLSGTIAADSAVGVIIAAAGQFKGAAATFAAKGARIVGINSEAPWPFQARFASSILTISGKGTMVGPFNTRDMVLSTKVRGGDLKHLDAIIEAGLFGTQPIALTGQVRHKGHDWFIDQLVGTIGRSRIVGRANVLRRDGRTKIDATIHSSQFDFDDLANDAGLAIAAAKRGRIGKRVIPDTRINLSKMGPTDGVLRFSADRLLFKSDSVFRSLSGTLRLDRRDLQIDNIVAGMTSGRMTGTAHVNSRGEVPVLSTDLRFEGATLEHLIGSPDNISGAVRGRVRLSGRGDTVREAMSTASGTASMVATQGSVKSTVAYVLGQDLGGAIGQAIGGNKGHVPLRCLVADFRATNGALVPSPLAIETGVSVGRGSGRMVLNGETIALTISGASKGRGILRIIDPIRIGGTLTSPSITVAGLVPTEKPRAQAVLKLLGRSIGAALGLRKDAPQSPSAVAQSLDCQPLVAAALN